MKRKDFKKLGKLNYDTFCKGVNWQSQVPEFSDQRQSYREAWISAAKAIYEALAKKALIGK